MRVFGWSDGAGGVFHYRIREPLRGLRLRGHDTLTSQALQLNMMDSRDVILVRALNNRHESQGWEALARQGKHLLVYDLDDDIWAWNPGSPHAQYWNSERRLRAEINIQLADVVTTPSEALAEILARLNPNVRIIPNTVPKWLTSMLPERRDPTRFIVGWEGAHQHVKDLELVYRPVFRFMVRHKEVEFHLWGPHRDTWLPTVLQWLPPGIQGRVVCHDWQSDVAGYYRSLAMDVALAPLEDTPFNDTKSGIRVQEHSALGIPIIASPRRAYMGYLIPGHNGFFADSAATWERCLEEIYSNRGMAARLGETGRRLAKVKWTTEGNSEQLETIYEEALRVRTSTRQSANARAGTKPASTRAGKALAATTYRHRDTGEFPAVRV